MSKFDIIKHSQYLLLKADIANVNIVKSLGFLSENDKKKANTFSNIKSYNQFVVGRFLLANALFNINKSYLYETDIGEYGKPFLVDNNHFFNISHSGNFVYLAISNYEIGIDVEIIKPKNYQRIIINYFNSVEIEYLSSFDQIESLSVFYQMWTIKEAIIKCKAMSVLYINKLSPINNISLLKDFKNSIDGTMIHSYFDKEQSSGGDIYSTAVSIAIKEPSKSP